LDKTRLGPDNINLQTEELHYNYSVLIVSPEWEESSLLHYPTIINFRRIIRRKNYIIIIFLEYDIGPGFQSRYRENREV